ARITGWLSSRAELQGVGRPNGAASAPAPARRPRDAVAAGLSAMASFGRRLWAARTRSQGATHGKAAQEEHLAWRVAQDGKTDDQQEGYRGQPSGARSCPGYAPARLQPRYARRAGRVPV